MKIALYAAGASLLASTAFAGGLTPPVAEPVIATPVAPVAVGDWTGFYAGLQYGQGKLEIVDGASFAFDAYGAHAGYLRDFGQFVVGAEIDYNELDAGALGGSSIDMLRLRARVGYDMGDFLPYATIGMAQISAGDETETGMSYGIGGEFKVTERISLGAEFSWNDFELVGAPEDTSFDTIQVRASYRF